MTALLISVVTLILGIATAVYNKKLAHRNILYYRKSRLYRSYGPDYDERPLRAQNIIAGITLTAMGIAGTFCSFLAEASEELASLKSVFIAGAIFILFSMIVVQVVWFGLSGKRN
jgi:hypothetical protein